MLTRYMGMTPESQSYLFTFGLALTLLGMVLTDMWLPMVVGAIIMTGLAVESWIRVQHLIPIRKELRDLHHQIEQVQKQQRKQAEE
ncbi:conserved hypothetical protein [Vibrio nigripulchritudo MADA3029]|uniref:NADH dehydrogenase subunit II-related protein n=1 Tax=Vibrio nigripulchritudo SOn1 TaxID=1238450 RepID=A0AAV2VSK0_9VIBR|nr:hypothetical protein [Vibrio nigripulchritudo]CCN46253.1 conserved hypothetical protein [Vibrio nigripulchritudo MADA3020]CCN55118.1 conserved hypothetical protein [Vibrio nigripulchritudo MADA3021]CCN59651.1 conserved hypothetical protein [Vibrio nigripulchritudo MADA3029]CCO47641.1 conserved hypothetical protein [Vibrio nigripulchritudo SOn1]